MKSYEENWEKQIMSHTSFAVRLDGRNFSKLTKGLQKPFDKKFSAVMVRTMNDLITEFKPSTAYTHSDEITLLFPATCTLGEYYNVRHKHRLHPYDGRVLKLCTVMSGYCSARFNFHMSNIFSADKENESVYANAVIDRIEEQTACFDARTIIFMIPPPLDTLFLPEEDKTHDMVYYMVWRSVHDCYRNIVTAYGSAYLNHRVIQGKSSKDIVNMLRVAYNMDFEKDVSTVQKHGVYGKKEPYKKEVVINGETVKAIRYRIRNFALKIKANEEMQRFLTSKLYFEPQSCEAELIHPSPSGIEGHQVIRETDE